MKRYRGGDKVAQGIYWNLRTGEFFQSQGAALPDGDDQRYIRVPAPFVLVAGPLIGLGYVIFLPLVGIVGLLTYLGNWLARLVRRAFQETTHVVVPAWVPGVSYLARGRRGRERRQHGVQEPLPNAVDRLLEELEEVEQGLQERRRRGEK